MRGSLKTSPINLNNWRIFVLVLGAMLTLRESAAQITDSTKTDVIVRVDGVLVYGKVVAVDQQVVRYKAANVSDGPIISLPRNLVYIISYSNSTTQLITPEFGRTKIKSTAFDGNLLSDDPQAEPKSTWKNNLQHGSLKVGMGFGREFSGINGVDDFSKAASAPSLFVSYHFRFNRFMLVGASLGFASYNYRYNFSSDYDRININQKIRESVVNLGLFARYNILDGFTRPYLLGGFNFNYSDVNFNGEIFFIDDQKRISTTSGLRGFKTSLVLRAGVDLHISKRFGLYSDIGLGTSLLQLGAIFILD